MKTFVVKEYDRIYTGNNNFDIKREKYKYLEYKIFSDLKSYVKNFEDKNSENDVLDFVNITYKRISGEVITLKNYVGVIQFNNNYQVEILPKIDYCDENETKKIFLKMLRRLKGLEAKNFTNANLNITNMNLFDIFIEMYLQELKNLLKMGLKSAYVEKEDNLNYYKGKLLIKKHIISNLCHNERFYLLFDEFSLNRVENKLIKSTLLKLKSKTENENISREIRQVLSYFENIEESYNYDADFQKIVNDRNKKFYDTIMNWSYIFLYNKSFSTFSGNKLFKSLLFPMEKVFQDYVAYELKNRLKGWSVKTQVSSEYLFEEPRKQFKLKPDIIIEKNEKKIILDTKWKNLENNVNKNYGISSTDMYQMYVYAKKYDVNDIWLIYPINESMNSYIDRNNITFLSKDKDSSKFVNIKLFFVDLRNDTNLNELVDKLNNKG